MRAKSFLWLQHQTFILPILSFYLPILLISLVINMDWDGGFINDGVVEEPQKLTNSVSVGGDDKNKSTTAVSVSQIAKLTRPNEGLVIHGKKVYQIHLIAFVYEILDVNPQKIHLLVDDYTSGGPLEMSYIIGDVGTPGDDPSLSMFNDIEPQSDEPRSIQDLKVGDYVNCFGVVKYNQDKPNVVAYNLRFVEDPNEVTMHHLEVIRDSLFYESIQRGGSLSTSKPEMSATTNYNQPQNDKNEFGKLSNRDKHVLKFLREKSNEQGIHLNEICTNFKAFTKDEILDSLNTLNAEGQCWNGDNEEIWCVST